MTDSDIEKRIDEILKLLVKIVSDSPLNTKFKYDAKQYANRQITAILIEARIAGINEAHKEIMEYAYTYTGDDEMADFCGVDDLSRVAMSWKHDRIAQLKTMEGKGE